MASSQTKIYGLHLMIDGYDANPKKLSDVSLLYQTLNELPGRIGMHKVGFPHIIQFTAGAIAGLSGFIFIVESHISIHTYSRKKFFSMDLYSCKNFEPQSVIDYVKKIYEITEMEKYLIKRGRRFPAGDLNLRQGNDL